MGLIKWLLKKKEQSIQWEDYSNWEKIDNIFSNKKVIVAVSEADTFLYVEAIKVKEKYRNKGYGTKKMQEIIKYATDKNKSIILKASDAMGSDLDRLYEFYNRFGFKKGNLISNYHHNMYLHIKK